MKLLSRSYTKSYVMYLNTVDASEVGEVEKWKHLKLMKPNKFYFIYIFFMCILSIMYCWP